MVGYWVLVLGVGAGCGARGVVGAGKVHKIAFDKDGKGKRKGGLGLVGWEGTEGWEKGGVPFP